MELRPLPEEPKLRFFIDGVYYSLEASGMSREQAQEILLKEFPDAEVIENPPED